MQRTVWAISTVAALYGLVSGQTGVIPRLSYWHNYNLDGESHWARCNFSHFVKADLASGIPPFLIDTVTNTSIGRNTVRSSKLVVIPATYDGDWHPDPVPQLNVIISGHMKWTTADMVSHVVGPGEFYLGTDQGTEDARGRTRPGHLSKAVGGEPVVMLCTQFKMADERKMKDTPCWL